MTNEFRIAPETCRGSFVIRASSFFRISSFVIRTWEFLIWCPAFGRSGPVKAGTPSDWLMLVANWVLTLRQQKLNADATNIIWFGVGWAVQADERAGVECRR